MSQELTDQPHKSFWEHLYTPVAVIGGVATFAFLVFDRLWATTIVVIFSILTTVAWKYSKNMAEAQKQPDAVKQLNPEEATFILLQLQEVQQSLHPHLNSESIRNAITRLHVLAARLEYLGTMMRCKKELEGYEPYSELPYWRHVEMIVSPEPCPILFSLLPWKDFKEKMLVRDHVYLVRIQLISGLSYFVDKYNVVSNKNYLNSFDCIEEEGKNYHYLDKRFQYSQAFLYCDVKTYEKILIEMRDWLTRCIQYIVGQVKLRA